MKVYQNHLSGYNCTHGVHYFAYALYSLINIRNPLPMPPQNAQFSVQTVPSKSGDMKMKIWLLFKGKQHNWIERRATSYTRDVIFLNEWVKHLFEGLMTYGASLWKRHTHGPCLNTISGHWLNPKYESQGWMGPEIRFLIKLIIFSLII